MKKTYQFIMMTMTLTMMACSEAGLAEEQQGEQPQELSSPNRQHNGHIIVRDGNGPLTRAMVDNDLSVIFGNGDKIGVFVMSGDNTYMGNIQVTYNSESSEWVPSSQIPYSTTYTYYAYYPYDAGFANAEDITPSASTAASFFSNYRRRLNFWSSDQSTLEKLMACDFMVAKGEVTEGTGANDGSVVFTMEHEMALFQLELNGRPNVARTARNSRITYTTQNDYSWTNVKENTNLVDYITMPASTTFYGNKPCLVNGSYLFLAPPQQNTTITTYQDASSAGSGYWTVTLKAPAGRYIHKQVMTDETSYTVDYVEEERYYTMAVGDILGSDGSLWKTTDASSKGQNAEPIGLVFRIGYDDDTFKHGLVLGLKDVGTSLAWSTNETTTATSTLDPLWDTGSNALPITMYQYMSHSNGETFSINDDSYTTQSGQNGLANTIAILAATANDRTQVPVFNALSSYALPTFTGSSIWFIPSISEMITMVGALGNLNTENIDKPTTTTSYKGFWYSQSDGTAIRDALNSRLANSGAASYDAFVGISSVQGCYWSSTEFNNTVAFSMHLSSTGGSTSVTGGLFRFWANDTYSIKTRSTSFRARACIAF